MQSEKITALKNNMLFHLKQHRPRLAILKLHEDDFIEAFDALTKEIDNHNKIDDKVWAFVLQGLANATKGKNGSGKKENTGSNL